MSPDAVGKCEKCDEPEVTQGRCYDCSRLCPKCRREPCNGNVPDPECNQCILDYRPEGWTKEMEEEMSDHD